MPVPPALGLCTDATVNGAPFYVMGFVDGVVLDSAERAATAAAGAAPPGQRAPRRRARRSARRRHRRGRPRRPRQARGLHRAPGEAVVDAVGELEDPGVAGDRRGRRARCASTCPVQQGVAIAHGDFRFGNCLTDVEHGRINAVLDWELCTLGDPLADVGYLGVYWYRRRHRERARQRSDVGRRVRDRYAELARALRLPHGPRCQRHRLLHRVRLLAAGGDQRGGVCTLSARCDG